MMRDIGAFFCCKNISFVAEIWNVKNINTTENSIMMSKNIVETLIHKVTATICHSFKKYKAIENLVRKTKCSIAFSISKKFESR